MLLSDEAVCGKTWRLTRGDGSLLAGRLRLGLDHKVAEYDCMNERGWRVAGGRLELLSEGGMVTTRFDQAVRDADGRLHLRGVFLGAASRGAENIMRELAELAAPRVAAPVRWPRVAMLVRTHAFTRKVADLMAVLSASGLWDLYVLADESAGPIATAGYPKLAHSLQTCRELGLDAAQPGTLWHCGDYALYCAVAALPGYDVYAMLESDVHLTRGNPAFLEALIARLGFGGDAPIDLLTSYLSPAQPDWCWRAAAQPRYAEVLACFFPFVLVSARAAAALLDGRRQTAGEAAGEATGGAAIHCEAYVASELHARGGFRLASMLDLLPGCIDLGSFRPAWEHLDEPWVLLGDDFGVAPAIEMVHPVHDAVDYLACNLELARRRGSLAAFAERLRAGRPGVLPQRLVSAYLQALESVDAAAAVRLSAADERGAAEPASRADSAAATSPRRQGHAGIAS